MQEWQSDSHEGMYHAGHFVVTEKESGRCGIVQLRDTRGRDVTLAQFRDCVRSHGAARALATFARLVRTWQV
jgi:hypothetical protein